MIISKKRGCKDQSKKFSTPVREISSGKRLKMVAGSFYIPKVNKLKPLGDDDYFICEERNTIGVADGVGGWARKGIDAGKYARELMTNSVWAIHQQPEHDIDPQKVLNRAFLNTDAKGSSTACIVTVREEESVLHATNVGDSGFLLIRGGKVVYRSPIQQHSFNCPYQLGKKNDSPNLAEEIKVSVVEGDTIVVGTDGLFDNLDASEIKEIVIKGLAVGEDADQIAWTIAEFARNASMDTLALSPFARAASEQGLGGCLGGKVDDITVVVAFLKTKQK